MVGAVAEVVEPEFCVIEESAGCGAHSVAVCPFDNAGGGGKGGATDGVVFGAGPETEDDQIGLVALPPGGAADVGGGGPDNGASAGDGRRVAGGFAFRVDDQPGVVAEIAEGFC